jgi:FkbM family methyltransferase
MRQKIEEAFLRLVRLYTYNTPIKKGKYRLYQAALGLCSKEHRSLSAAVRDGRRFVVDLTSGIQEGVFFIGEFETVLTEIMSRLISPGDVCVDVGANFGWYTSLMALHAGAGGEVHAFEPVPATFEKLRETLLQNGSPSNVHLNNFALGDEPGTVEVHVFDSLGTGYASMSGKPGVDSAVVECRVETLDNYLIENDIGDVDIVKADIEGAELLFLKGALRLFTQPVPPIMMIEMAIATTTPFDYHPNDLLDLIASHAAYEFYAVDEWNGTVRRFDRFAEGEIGANVFCVPANADERRKAVVADYLIN